MAISIRIKLQSLTVATLIGLLVVAAVALGFHRTALIEDRRAEVRHLVESAHSVLQHYYELQRSGALDEASAQRAAAETISRMRYRGTEYFWINDLGRPFPRMIMHPTVPSLNGKELSDERFNCATMQQAGIDAPIERTDGKKNLFVAAVEVASRSGEGYVGYLWPKPLADGGVTQERYPKLSFVKRFEPWQWMIGSGIYIDDVDALFWQQALRLGGLIALIALLLGVGMWAVSRTILAPLSALQTALVTAERNNDLTVQAPIRQDDELGAIARAFNTMMGAFRQALGAVSRGAHAVFSSSASIAQSTETLARRATEQSEASTSMASAVEQLTASIDQIATSADETVQIAHEWQRLATEGEDSIGRAIEEMRGIVQEVRETAQQIATLGERSTEISSVVNTISEIADQTNLLALNAAIEAARAGESGRGFAVVADEVRKLAERTSVATAEITQMISALQEGTSKAVAGMEHGTQRVEQGVGLTLQVGETMHGIREGTQKVLEAIRDISAALQEQRAASAQVAHNIERTADSVEQTRQETERIAQAASDLERLAQEVEAVIARFRL
ncbi:methyl-accepting chemotaxis protein [Tepidiphilus baoligensis]|uniref:HAMP domain-containing protein n=1 Tax=Tepidiphilus baoligensis TaxID=2698687 RepID=A0ABX1QK51_9PROT|nr:methyl-accepting chemotaxis protein [Tepidiphilus baoligensis]NMH15661.1 HAMP domain-containing protein [Tepidiphilus baoligensis]